MCITTINAKVLIPLDVTVDVNEQDGVSTECSNSWNESVKTIIKYKAIEMISNGNIDTSRIVISECDNDDLVD